MGETLLLTNALIWQWRKPCSAENGFEPIGETKKGSILIMNGVIMKLFDETDEVDFSIAEKVVDCEGKLIVPGLIGKIFYMTLVILLFPFN